MKKIEEENKKEQEQMTMLDLDKPAEKVVVGGFLDKNEFVNNRQNVIIKTLIGGKFGKPVIVFEYKNEDKMCDLNGSMQNSLIDLIGPLPRNWLGKTISLEGKPDRFNVKGRMVNGVTLIVHPAIVENKTLINDLDEDDEE